MKLVSYPILHRRIVVIGLAVGFMAAALSTVKAQSGRRSTTTPSTAPSVSGPKTVEKKPQKAPSLQLVVGIEDPSPLLNIPYYLSDTVLDGCLRRITDAADVFATSAGRGLGRTDASRRAKNEQNRYVVWLQIGSEMIDSGKPSKNGPDELYVSYIIFEPVSGKVKQSGRTHHSIYKTGRGGVLSPTASRNSPLYSEYAMKQAAREAAERVLAAFDITLRSER